MRNLMASLSVVCGLLSTAAWSLQTDQAQPTVNASRSIDYYAPVGQTFVPAQSQLAAIQLWLADSGGAIGVGSTVHIELHQGGITGPLIAVSETVALEDCFNFSEGPGCGLGGGNAVPVEFVFTGAIAVQPGEKYSFVVMQESGTGINAGYSYDDTYPQGELISNGEATLGDLAFVTYSAPISLILVSNNNRLLTYSMAGELLDSVVIDGAQATELARDLVSLDDGSVAIFNGVFSPQLSILSDTQWQHYRLDGWSIVNNVSYGGIAMDDEYIYITDMATAGAGAPSGIVRFPKANPTDVQRYFDGMDFIDITLGLDGKLYALENIYGDLQVIDPTTMTPLKSLGLGRSSGSRAVTADASGQLFMVSWNGTLHRYDANGVEQQSVALGYGSLMDIDIDGDRLLVSARNGTVALLGTDLVEQMHFTAPEWNAFATFQHASTGAPPLDYCAASGLNTRYEWINALRVDDTESVTGDNGGYLSADGVFAQLRRGDDYLVELLPGYGYGVYSEFWRMWLDANRDGEFSESELLLAAAGRGSLLENISVPVDATLGVTGLRLAMAYGQQPAPCAELYYGEVEDYQVEIIAE